MPKETVLLQLENSDAVARVLEQAATALEAAEGELLVDFSAVRQIDSAALRSIEALAQRAEEQAVRVSLRGIDPPIYKVLKLMKLTEKFTFSE